MLVVSAAVGILCGILWPHARLVAVWIFLALSLYTLIDEIISIVNDFRHGHAGADILAVVAIVATASVQAFWALWIIDLMVFTGDAIETFAQNRAKQNLTALMDAAPDIAHVLNNDATADATSDAAWSTVPVDQVKIGDRLVVKPGETIPIDGVLLSNEATIDLSMINGEPVPVDVYAGATLASGAINGSVALIMRATALAGDSQYQKILNLVRSAEESRATVVRAADILAVPFTIVSLAIAIIAWIVSKDPMRFAQVLVLATPCPLLIAAPVAYMGGTGRLAKHSVIVKTQDVIEQLGNVTHVFFDKTGTLTNKRPSVERIDLATTANGLTGDDVLRLAGPIEAYSVHILAKGIVNASHKLAHDTGVPALTADQPQEDAGQGIRGIVNGHDVAIGRLSYLARFVSDPRQAQELAAKSPNLFPTALAANEMATYVAIDGALAARIVLKDFARKNAASTIGWLKRLGIKRLSMVTGDTWASAQAIASEVGIDDVHAALLPEQKVEVVAEGKKETADTEPTTSQRIIDVLSGFRQPQSITMMVGDGVNDAPTLASADIGVAITDGSSTAASQSAQAVIMNNDISMVPLAITIARQTKSTMFQACALGIGLAIILMVMAAFNLIPVVVGALLQEAIDSCSIFWALTAIIDKKSGETTVHG
ncbi:MAG: heavy metal translocating P-type ATPase [Bifidobacteriaceae bacterium]|nr:heavy metal translocating P-type ATPase [Bifidobacteriaceae bacterium]